MSPGAVSDPSAHVTVNGMVATVIGNPFLAAGVPQLVPVIMTAVPTSPVGGFIVVMVGAESG
jgi:hypothetical protein